MKVLRASPVSAWVLALALQSFIFCCWLLSGAAGGAALRQVFMNALRSSPDRFLALASALQLVILSCCELSACTLIANAAITQAATHTNEFRRRFMIAGSPSCCWRSNVRPMQIKIQDWQATGGRESGRCRLGVRSQPHA